MNRLLYIFLFSFTFNSLFSQLVVNEIIIASDTTIIIEIFNSSPHFENIESVTLSSDSLEITRNFEKDLVQPEILSLIELTSPVQLKGLGNLYISIKTTGDQFYTSFEGYILKGESAGRYPDITGEFGIYENNQISSGRPNIDPGIFRKVTSRTKFSPRDSSPNAALYYDGYYWIFGGWDQNEGSNDWSSKTNIWKSKNGLDWTLINPHPPFKMPYAGYVVFNNKMMVFYQDTVFITEDALTWEKHTCNAFTYENYRYIVFKDELYCFSFEQMWKSDDGINWTLYNTDFPSDSFRYLPALVTDNDQFWLYGGEAFNDVWNSRDGIHWQRILNNAPWIPRIWFNFTYFDNKMWIIGGNDQDISDSLNFGNLRDFWNSSDGVNWHLLEVDTTYHNRHGCFLWNDGKRVLLSSGFGNDYINRMYNDVWELDPPFILTSAKNSDSQTVCINTPIGNIAYTVKGGTQFKATGLPAGVTGLYDEGVFTISGWPTFPGTFNYTVTIDGVYDLPSVSGSITVLPANEELTISPMSGSKSQSVCLNTPLTDIIFNISGDTSPTVSGLPPGVHGSYNAGLFTISGEPYESGTYDYTLTVNGHCFNPSTAGTIIVSPAHEILLSSPEWSKEQYIRVNTPLTDIVYFILNVTDATVSGLPDGVTGSFDGGVFTIRGVPKESGTFHYFINTYGTCVLPFAEGEIKVSNSVIFPNPTSGMLKILNRGPFYLAIFDRSGKQIFDQTCLNSYPILEKDFSPVFGTSGMYIIYMKDLLTGQIYTEKIIFVL